MGETHEKEPVSEVDAHVAKKYEIRRRIGKGVKINIFLYLKVNGLLHLILTLLLRLPGGSIDRFGPAVLWDYNITPLVLLSLSSGSVSITLWFCQN